jgi:hypothetical protein
MFTRNAIQAQNLEQRHVDEKYFVLYYQFIKHAFGLIYSPPQPQGVDLRIYPDKLPDMAEQILRFKSFLVGLSVNPDFRRAGGHPHPPRKRVRSKLARPRYPSVLGYCSRRHTLQAK